LQALSTDSEEILKKELQKAVKNEEFEFAAILQKKLSLYGDSKPMQINKENQIQEIPKVFDNNKPLFISNKERPTHEKKEQNPIFISNREKRQNNDELNEFFDDTKNQDLLVDVRKNRPKKPKKNTDVGKTDFEDNSNPKTDNANNHSPSSTNGHHKQQQSQQQQQQQQTHGNNNQKKNDCILM